MKKNLVLFSLLFSIGALAEVPVEAVEASEEAQQAYAATDDMVSGPNFVAKGLTALDAKCRKAHKGFMEAQDALKTVDQKRAHWEAVQADCAIVEKLMNTVPETPITKKSEPTELPNDEI